MDREFGRSGYDETDGGEFERDLVFVVMPFASEMDDVYSAIRDECAKLRLVAQRVDEAVGSGFVLRKITDLIERAEFVICDLTHERPNVYYELGYAHGVGNEAEDILLLARAGTNLHFDIAPLRAHYYRSIDHLREITHSALDRGDARLDGVACATRWRLARSETRDGSARVTPDLPLGRCNQTSDKPIEVRRSSRSPRWSKRAWGRSNPARSSRCSAPFGASRVRAG